MFQDYRPRITKFLLVALLFSVIPATSSTAAQTMTACVTKKTGAMRLLTKGTCKKTEKKMTWNVQGEQGIPGVAGTAGPVGPAGATGPAGAAGTNGAAGVSGKDGIDGKGGNTILYGTTNPTASIGVAGDFYINTATSTLFGPKTTTWPNGTSLVGPTGAGAAGPAGPAGAQGPAGPAGAQGPAGAPGASGASTSILWLTPRDLEASRNGKQAMFGATDTATVESLQLTQNDFHAESLRITMGAPKVVFRAVPKGWGEATSLKIRVYWIIEANSSAPVAFDVYLQSRGAGNDFGSDNWGLGAIPDQSNGEAVSSGQKYMNVHSFTWSMDGAVSDGELLTLSLYRHPTTFRSYVFDGVVHIMGVSIEAIFP